MNMQLRRSMIAIGAALAVGFPVHAADPPAAPAIKRTVLRTVEVPNSNHEVVVVLIEAPANARSGRHTHPGTVVGYVLDGEYTMLIDGQPPKQLKAGDSTEVPAGAVHDEGAGNAPAKVIAVFTVEKGKPRTTPVKQTVSRGSRRLRLNVRIQPEQIERVVLRLELNESREMLPIGIAHTAMLTLLRQVGVEALRVRLERLPGSASPIHARLRQLRVIP